jgi:hypothetical protein
MEDVCEDDVGDSSLTKDGGTNGKMDETEEVHRLYSTSIIITVNKSR